MENLSLEILGVKFENPFVLAATPCTDEIEMVVDALRLGWAGAALKTTAVDGKIVALKYPMMQAIAFGNRRMVTLGNIDLISEVPFSTVEKTVSKIKDKFPNKVIIPSIMAENRKDWTTLARDLMKAGADMIECSFSCPQGNMGEDPGKTLAQSKEATKKVTAWVKEGAKDIPVLIKLTPHVTDILEIAQAVKDGGGDAVVITNSVIGLLGIDIASQRPVPTVNGYGCYAGITGPSVKPITLKNISSIAKNVKIPVFGVGGVSDYRDAIEFMLAGASGVQIGTEAMHNGFRIIDSLTDGLAEYLESKKLPNVKAVIGKALPYIVDHDRIPYKIGQAPVSSVDETKCILCNKCYIACHDGGHRAITLKDGKIVIDEEKCVGCGFCVGVCPVEAISLVKRTTPQIKEVKPVPVKTKKTDRASKAPEKAAGEVGKKPVKKQTATKKSVKVPVKKTPVKAAKKPVKKQVPTRKPAKVPVKKAPGKTAKKPAAKNTLKKGKKK